jgi:Fur family ferric uptake transcriptional regulator
MISKKNLPCGRPKPERQSLRSAAQLLKWQKQLREFLISRDLKYTEQRWNIAELILSTGGHLDAQDLVDRVHEVHSGIGAATVYRTLKVLCDALILRESLTGENGKVYYELYDEEHHDHIFCLDCNQIFEFHDEKIENLQEAVLKKMDFKELRHRHVVYAKCTFK